LSTEKEEKTLQKFDFLNENGERFSALNKETVNFANVVNKIIDRASYRSKSRYQKHTKEDIRKWLDNPSSFSDNLVMLSNHYYNSSSQYTRLVNYMVNLLSWAYTIDVVNISHKEMKSKKDKIEKDYFEVCSMIENMNISHEMKKVLHTVFREDVFFGVEHETKTSYYIQKLPSKFCFIYGIEDGSFTFAFDFSYFDTNDVLNSYDDEFKTKYKKYQANKKEYRYQLIDSSRSICIKANEELDYILPPFSATFDSAYDIDLYKRSRDNKEKLGNYKILTQKIPVREDSDLNNDFIIDIDTAMMFHNQIVKSLPQEIGLLTSPMELQEFNFKGDTGDIDNVSKVQRDFWESAGVSQTLFNANANSSMSMGLAIKTDEQLVFGLATQIERWLNRKIKKRFKNFRINILEVTRYNQTEVIDNLVKTGSVGMPIKTALASTLGMSPSTLLNTAMLENEILNLDDLLKPLVTSQQMTALDKQAQAGRPTSGQPLTDEGQKTKEQNKNKENK
jgi:hypothetical protein